MATVTIRLNDETRQRLDAAAAARRVPLSDYIREALEAHLTLEQAGEIGVRRPRNEGDISLTPYQRRMLVLQHQILLAAKGDLRDDYYNRDSEAEAIQLLEHGFTGEYDKEFAGIHDPMTLSECELLWDIFDMFRSIQASVRELGKDGWQQLSVEDAERFGTFRGFDFNETDESRLASYAKYLIKTGRYTEQAEAFSVENDRGNSHALMLPTYRAMLRVFKPLWSKAVKRGFGRHHLPVAQLELILLAAPGATRPGAQFS